MSIERSRAANQAFIDNAAPRRLLIHAGVATRPGICLLLPGRSEAGKSTLTAGLVRAGWAYVSDELAVLDPVNGAIEAYPRPIQLDPGSYRLFEDLGDASGRAHSDEQWHLDPTELGSRSDIRPTEPTHLVFPAFVNGERTQLTPVSKATALSRMIELAMSLRQHPRSSFRVLCDIATRCSAAELVSSNLDEQVAAIDKWVGA